jgi:hypothetical protein
MRHVNPSQFSQWSESAMPRTARALAASYAMPALSFLSADSGLFNPDLLKKDCGKKAGKLFESS